MPSTYSLQKSSAFRSMHKWMYNQLTLPALTAHWERSNEFQCKSTASKNAAFQLRFSYQISPKYVTTGASINPTAKPSITNPMKISATLVAWYNVIQPMKYGILTSIIDNRRPNGSDKIAKISIKNAFASKIKMNGAQISSIYPPAMPTADFPTAEQDIQCCLQNESTKIHTR